MSNAIEALRAAYAKDRDHANWNEADFDDAGFSPDRCAYIAAAANAAPELLAELDSLKAERDGLRAALEQDANPLNWNDDRSGVRRVWLEPGSSTPAAYNGFELARAALKDQS